ncbi:MAG: YihY/virulence factor BrkB family protein [Gammaproteobacteria bacterium]|nr:YihY/virulence factor BrkB family protein [Gammaproteobacteria bacterium]
MLKALHQTVRQWLWDPRIPSAGWPLRTATRVLRFPYALLRDAMEGELTLRAMSLVYTTLLSVVPLIALSFSVLKAFNFQEQLEPLMYGFLEPFGEDGRALTDQIMSFVDNQQNFINDGQGVTLASLGLVFLIYTVVVMVQKIEEAFNFTWQVQRPRSIGRRFSEYFSVILIAPVLLASALALKATAEQTEFVKWLLQIDVISDGTIFVGQFVPYLLVIGAFAFVYGFVPNTKVTAAAAFVGGIVGGLVWSLVGGAFSSFIGLSTRYELVYSSLAIPLLVLMWLYVSWLIVLLGARISYYYQHPEFLRRGREKIILTNRMRERLAMAVMYYVGDEFRNERPHWHVNSLAQHLGVPADSLAEIVNQLEARKLLVVTEDDILLPGSDTECIKLVDIFDAVRRSQRDQLLVKTASLQRIDVVIEELENLVGEHLSQRSLRDLIEARGSQDSEDDDAKVRGLFPATGQKR